jgi:MFS family permease
MKMEDVKLYPKYRWFIMISFAMTSLVSAIVMIAPAPMVGLISKSYGITVGQTTGLMMGSLTLIGFFAAMAGGALVDKYGYPGNAIAANLLMLLGTMLMPFSGGSFTTVIILRVIQGIGTGLLVGCSAAIAVMWFPKHQRGIVTGIQGMSISLGVALAFAFVPIALTATGSWSSAIAVMSVAPAIALVLAIITLFGPKPPKVAEEYDSPIDSKGDLAIAFKQPATYVGMLVAVCFYWIFQAFNDLTPGYYSIDPPVGVGYGIAVGSQLMGIMQIAFLIGAFLSGFILQKVFKGVAKHALVLSFVLTAIFTFSVRLPFVYGNKLTALLTMIFIGFFMSFLAPVFNAFVSLHYPAHIAGKIGGIWTAIGGLGGTVGIIVGASFLHYSGNYKLSITTVSIVAIVGLVLAFFLNPPKVFRKREETLPR